MQNTPIGIIDRINGVMYGVAVGDALGGPLEFMNADEIKGSLGTVRDMIGGGWLSLHPGEVTDDTQMTIAVAQGIVDAPDNPIEAIGKRFIAWYKSDPKDIGNICAHSIYLAMSSDPKCPTAEQWYDAAYTAHEENGGRSAGNGSLMRTAYPALYYPNALTASSIACSISRMTHYDARATHACNVYTGILSRLIPEDDLITRRRVIEHKAIAYGYGDAVYSSFDPEPSGFVRDSFAAALYCIASTDTFEDAIVKAVNLGGDADTIGAITGGLAGALYGCSRIPLCWLDALEPDTSAQLDYLCQKAVMRWEN